MKKKNKFGIRAFVQHWGCYPTETVVIVGTRRQEDVMWLLKKLSVEKGVLKDVDTWIANNDLGLESDNGLYLNINAGGRVFTAIFLKEWPKKATWKHYQVLMHELHHAVHDCLGRRRGMMDEWEAQAYAQEMLFEHIRRKLDGIDKCEMVYL